MYSVFKKGNFVMTNPIFNPQPNYSGVTIQITNPAVYTGQGNSGTPFVSGGYLGADKCNCNCIGTNSQGYISYPQGSYAGQKVQQGETIKTVQSVTSETQEKQEANTVTNPAQNSGYQQTYPAQYYLNNYNLNGEGNSLNGAEKQPSELTNTSGQENPVNSYKMYADKNEQKDNDMSKSRNIIGDLSEREAEIAEEKKNTKETKIVALTDEYIKSLENYLNNPNDEIRLMASKEILTRLDEDKDRYNDAALNALLNKMMQDPNKLVRIAALSAFSSQLASGNDYTVQLLKNIQSNPNSDKEDVLQAADILLKMSAGTEVKNIPNPAVKDNTQQQK